MAGEQSERAAGAAARWRTAGLVGPLAMLIAASASGEGFYRRGDATCSLSLSAVDLVATIRGLGGTSACGNDDCDRDGVLTAADIACTAGCVFDSCPIPEHAAHVTAIMPESAPGVSPSSVVRIAVDNLEPADATKRVTIGGREAEVIDEIDGELLVALPAELPTGAADIVVIVGEVEGAPTTVEIAPSLPLGPPDTLDGTLALIDEALAKLLTLDVETIYGDDAASVRQDLARARADTATQRAALADDATLTEADRIQLDAAIDASGGPEMLRALIAEIDAAAAAGGAEGGPAAPTSPGVLAFQRGASTLRIVGGILTTTTATLTAPEIAAIAGTVALIGGGLAVAAGALNPVIASATFTNAAGDVRGHPTGGGTVTIYGRRFDTLSTSLEIKTAYGVFDGGSGTSNGDGITFAIPNQTGLCGRVTLALIRTALRLRSNVISTYIQPELIRLPNTGVPGSRPEGEIRGASDCSGKKAVFNGVTRDDSVPQFLSERRAEVPVPSVLPGTYAVSLTVEGVRSFDGEDVLMQVGNGLTGLSVKCPAQVAIPDDAPAPPGDGVVAAPLIFAQLCEATLQPGTAPRPLPSRFTWTSSDPGKATIEASTSEPNGAIVGRGVGTTKIKATLVSAAGPSQTLATSQEVSVAVVDNAKPRISIESASMDVDPGSTITGTVTAADNAKLGLISFRATGDAVASAPADSLDCIGKKKCTTSFSLTLKSGDFTQTTVTLQADALDVGGNRASSNTLTFTINKDTTCPSVTIQEPANGATVNAGETSTVVAIAHDDGPNDTGVKVFTYSASGPALQANVDQNLPFATPMKAPTLRFNFAVRKPEDLKDVSDRNIVISVNAVDAAMPPNLCAPQTITVSVIGVLDQCSGGITTDNPSGFIDEPFTITVALTGDGADEITRVTSVNPGGTFDLQPQGGGVYTVTLFYQGTGSFALQFIAYDANGTARCSGSIGLESLGPDDGEELVGRAGAPQPAGAGLR